MKRMVLAAAGFAAGDFCKDGKAAFDISALQEIRKTGFVFFNCAVDDLKPEVFYA
jgi:hypothetical protein